MIDNDILENKRERKLILIMLFPELLFLAYIIYSLWKK